MPLVWLLMPNLPADGGMDDCFPARVHATLDLLDRHLATMKDQLTPKPLPGRAPPKKVVRSTNCTTVLVQTLLGACQRANLLAR